MSLAESSKVIAEKHLEQALVEILALPEASAEIKAALDGILAKLPPSVKALVEPYEGAGVVLILGLLQKGAQMIPHPAAA